MSFTENIQSDKGTFLILIIDSALAVPIVQYD